MATWEEWVQDVGGRVIKDYSSAEFSQPYELAKLQLQSLGTTGRYYTEGMRGVSAPIGQPQNEIQLGMLLIGGIVLAVVLLKD